MMFGFRHAFRGLFSLLKHERNFKVQLVCLILVVSAGIFFNISRIEWILIILTSSLVLSLEALNTSIEKLCDLYSTEIDNRIKTIKDIAAGSVLIASIFAVVTAIFVFYPYIVSVFN